MKAWFITSASRGFGERVARVALEQGDNVVATARDPAAVVEKLGAHPNLLGLPAVTRSVLPYMRARRSAASSTSR
jgi:NADP-dependent 3-hydroxy acid dehydrogenase YdfG